jgi:hypothetical protein
VHYGVPEGSYSTAPDGPMRILEFREMVQVRQQCCTCALASTPVSCCSLLGPHMHAQKLCGAAEHCAAALDCTGLDAGKPVHTSASILTHSL